MLYPGNIAETFDIKLEHIKRPNKIWNKLYQKWVPTSEEFVNMLLELIFAREAVKTFAIHLYNPLDTSSRKVYYALLEKVTEAARPLYAEKANTFCILHKGYSLN